MFRSIGLPELLVVLLVFVLPIWLLRKVLFREARTPITSGRGQVFCIKCGTVIQSTWRHCGNCGAAREADPQPIRPKSGTGNVVKIVLGVVAAWFVISGMVAIIVPKLGPSRMNANEMATIRQIQTINTAEVQYMSQFGKYATALSQLGPPTSGPPGPLNADLIPSRLSSGENNGYVFIVKPTAEGYTVNATPKLYNSTGRRSFFSDQNGPIHQSWSAEPANKASPELR